MPRNRSGGLAALGSSVRRTRPRPYTVRKPSPLKRRLVVGVLALVSLALITGLLPGIRRRAAARRRRASRRAPCIPFEVGAERLARPFRDAYGWLERPLQRARGERRSLKEQIEQLRNQAIQNATAASRAEVARGAPRLPPVGRVPGRLRRGRRDRARRPAEPVRAADRHLGGLARTASRRTRRS